jgi:ABC-type multidrug transport system ATPase subunit
MLQARVSLARAAYSQADVVLLDDPISAVDAYVGKRIVENCFLSGPLATRTRVLVTHALHVLDRTDYIYLMDNGRIIEQGSYAVSPFFWPCSPNRMSRFQLQQDLMSNSAVFRQLIKDHSDRDYEKSAVPDQKIGSLSGMDHPGIEDWSKTENAALMEAEERNVGAVSWNVYRKYLRSSGGLFWVPIILCLLLLNEVGSGMVSLQRLLSMAD